MSQEAAEVANRVRASLVGLCTHELEMVLSRYGVRGVDAMGATMVALVLAVPYRLQVVNTILSTLALQYLVQVVVSNADTATSVVNLFGVVCLAARLPQLGGNQLSDNAKYTITGSAVSVLQLQSHWVGWGVSLLLLCVRLPVEIDEFRVLVVGNYAMSWVQAETPQELRLVTLLGILYACRVAFLGRLPQAGKVYDLAFYLVTPTLRAAVSPSWALIAWMPLVYSVTPVYDEVVRSVCRVTTVAVSVACVRDYVTYWFLTDAALGVVGPLVVLTCLL